MSSFAHFCSNEYRICGITYVMSETESSPRDRAVNMLVDGALLGAMVSAYHRPYGSLVVVESVGAFTIRTTSQNTQTGFVGQSTNIGKLIGAVMESVEVVIYEPNGRS